MADDRDSLRGDQVRVGDESTKPVRMSGGAKPVITRRRDDDRIIERDPDLDRPATSHLEDGDRLHTEAGEQPDTLVGVRPLGTGVPDGHQDEHVRVREVGGREPEIPAVRPAGTLAEDSDVRAQPGDVLGISSGGETTSLGDTAEDEDRRRERAEEELRERERDRSRR